VGVACGWAWTVGGRGLWVGGGWTVVGGWSVWSVVGMVEWGLDCECV
jgi:hypothetical protein